MRSLFDKVKGLGRKAEEVDLKADALGSAEHVFQTCYEKKDGYFYEWVSQSHKDILKETTLNTIEGVFAEPDPVLALRRVIVEAYKELGEVTVMSTTPEFAMFKGITGEIRNRISDLPLVDQNTKELFEALEIESLSSDKILMNLNNRAHFLSLPFLAYGSARIILNDWSKDRTKDWLRPMCASYQIFMESHYRGLLGMPSALPDPLESIPHSSFPIIVLQGYEDPREEWENRWFKTFDSHSPFFEVEV